MAIEKYVLYFGTLLLLDEREVWQIKDLVKSTLRTKPGAVTNVLPLLKSNFVLKKTFSNTVKLNTVW